MYVCILISQPQQHKSKHKNTITAEKKESSKKRYTLYPGVGFKFFNNRF